MPPLIAHWPRAAALALALAAAAPAAAQAPQGAAPPKAGTAATAAQTPVSELTPEARRERIRQIVDDPALRGEPVEEDHRGFGWEAFQMFVVLGIVILLIYLTLNVGLRRLMGVRPSGGGRRSTVHVLERIPLDQKRMMFVVKAGPEYLLVGGAEGGLSLICKLDAAEVERVERERKAAPVAMPPFLQKLLTRRGGTPPQAG